MSIVTKGGDQGTTALMYNRRVPKHHPRVEAYGAVDELNAALGVARALVEDDFVGESLAGIQTDLVRLMGELATAVEDLPRYVQDGYELVTPEMTERLASRIAKAEAAKVSPGDWATPGASTASATLDLARTVCRRAERRACALQHDSQLQNPEIVVYLNRLSDLLWLLARWVETKPG